MNYIRITCVTIGFGRFARILENLLEMVEKGPFVSTCCKIGLCRLEELFLSSFLHITCELLYYWLCWPFNNETNCLLSKPTLVFLWGGGRGCFQWPFL